MCRSLLLLALLLGSAYGVLADDDFEPPIRSTGRLELTLEAEGIPFDHALYSGGAVCRIQCDTIDAAFPPPPDVATNWSWLFSRTVVGLAAGNTPSQVAGSLSTALGAERAAADLEAVIEAALAQPECDSACVGERVAAWVTARRWEQ